MIRSSDVLIVGAGPVGLTLGAELLRRGVAVRLVEKADRPHPHAKAIIMWPRALEALARIGAAEEVVARGHVIRAQNYSSGGRRLARTRFDGLTGTRHPYALSLPQEQTEAVLRERFLALGGEIEFGARFGGLRQDGGGVQVEFSGMDGAERWESRCRWLVGCDGAHSAVRRALGVPFTGASYPQQFLLADGPWETPLGHDEAHYYMTPSGVVVIVGLPAGQYRVFVSVAPDAPVDDPVRTVQEAASERVPVPVHLLGSPRTGVFRVHRRAAERFREGRVLLAGDAAHIHSPAGGQGLNTGIEDASSLAWRLAGVVHEARPESVLDEWERERRHVALSVVRDTDRQTRLWTMRGWRCRVRDAALHVAQATGVLDRTVVPRQAQLTLAYPGPRRRIGRLAVGGRLPDVPLPQGGWLHDLLRAAPDVCLVLFARPGSPGPDLAAGRWRTVPGVDVVQVESEAVRAALGLRGEVSAVVRPDGVVAEVDEIGGRRVTAWLERYLSPVPAARGGE
ncbi:pentachlorophenol monooxygenase [Sphaerisporangium melleum]|uniref:Pentachlorophenol monooxygenase n=1 Tax=Sphaerisporangium melleum TaxID=321316 RepID=A0A917R418_9ACTN|nr:FAD-dependent monooxygenase [Sphaerisporangium melleum]GGK87825.1 pentachlorophenol monooxygenase [Sphaerisporangium melleum]GII72449.1 pentachlorophenol monooxygenase [Sphaerisporangium melleum]